MTSQITYWDHNQCIKKMSAATIDKRKIPFKMAASKMPASMKSPFFAKIIINHPRNIVETY